MSLFRDELSLPQDKHKDFQKIAKYIQEEEKIALNLH